MRSYFLPSTKDIIDIINLERITKEKFKKAAVYIGLTSMAVGTIAAGDSLYRDHVHDDTLGKQAIIDCFSNNNDELCSLKQYKTAYDEMEFDKKQSQLATFVAFLYWGGTSFLMYGNSSSTCSVFPKSKRNKPRDY